MGSGRNVATGVLSWEKDCRTFCSGLIFSTGMMLAWWRKGDLANHRSSSHRWGGGAAIHRLFLQVRCLVGCLRHPSTRACPDQGRLQNLCQSTGMHHMSGKTGHFIASWMKDGPRSPYRLHPLLWVLHKSLDEGLRQTLVEIPYLVWGICFFSHPCREACADGQTKVSLSSTYHTTGKLRRNIRKRSIEELQKGHHTACPFH